ncbi:MAG: hypothetical protein AAF571_09940 [Verrucomicrobiota bacterium]
MVELKKCIIGNCCRELLVSAHDGLARLQMPAYLQENFDQIQMTFENVYPKWRTLIVAIRPYQAGEEQFADIGYFLLISW